MKKVQISLFDIYGVSGLLKFSGYFSLGLAVVLTIVFLMLKNYGIWDSNTAIGAISGVLGGLIALYALIFLLCYLYFRRYLATWYCLAEIEITAIETHGLLSTITVSVCQKDKQPEKAEFIGLFFPRFLKLNGVGSRTLALYDGKGKAVALSGTAIKKVLEEEAK